MSEQASGQKKKLSLGEALHQQAMQYDRVYREKNLAQKAQAAEHKKAWMARMGMK